MQKATDIRSSRYALALAQSLMGCRLGEAHILHMDFYARLHNGKSERAHLGCPPWRCGGLPHSCIQRTGGDQNFAERNVILPQDI